MKNIRKRKGQGGNTRSVRRIIFSGQIDKDGRSSLVFKGKDLN